MNDLYNKFWNEYTSKIEANIADRNFREMADRYALEIMEIPAKDYYNDSRLRFAVMLKCHVMVEQIKQEQA